MNLGELYIKISVDNSEVDSIGKAFASVEESIASVEKAVNGVSKAIGSLETSMVAEIATGFSHVGDSGSEATNSTNGFGDALASAVAKGQLFADAMETAFSKVIDLIGSAKDALVGFVQSSVDEFSAYEQNVESMNRTFGEYSQEFQSWISENASQFGMSTNQMLEHANKTGVLLQRDNAQRRAEEAAGEQESTEVQAQELSNRLEDLRANLSAQLSETRRHQQDEYDSWKDYYSDVYDELKASLKEEYEALKESLDARLDAQREANATELRERKEALATRLSELKSSLDAEYDSLKDSLSKRVKEQQSSDAKALRNAQDTMSAQLTEYQNTLNREYDSLKTSLSRRVSEQQKANERELRSRQDALDRSYDATKAALDAEVDAFNKATDERIRQINREYTEQYKLIDEEKYNQLKALQDKIDAIDAETKATERGEKAQAYAQQLAELERQKASARTRTAREKIAQQIAELETTIEKEKHKQVLADSKEGYRKEMDEVRTYYDNKKSELKEQQSEEVATYKATRKDELAALKASNSAQLKELKRAHSDEIQELKDSQKEQIESIKADNSAQLAAVQAKNRSLVAIRKAANAEAIQQLKDLQSERLDSIRSDNNEQLAAKKRSNDAIYAAQEKANDEEIRQLQSQQNERIKEIQRQNSELLKEKETSNSNLLKEQENFNSEQLKNLKNAHNDEIAAIQEHNRNVLQEERNLISEQKKLLSSGGSSVGYVQPDSEDMRQSMETLKKLFQTAADVGAARNMSTEEVLNILESVNYGRYATLDNLGLGYANKTGLQNLVSDMSGVVGRQLDPENFNDVAEALSALVGQFNMTNRASIEARTTVSGSFNALKSSWQDFKLAIATEGTDDDEAAIKTLFYGSGEDGDEGTVTNFLNNILPVVGRILEGVATFIKERGPEIFDRVWEIVVSALPPEWKEELDRLGEHLSSFVNDVSEMVPTVSDLITNINEVFKVINNILDTVASITGTADENGGGGLAGLGKIIGDVATAFGTLWTIGKIKDAVDLFTKLKGLIPGLTGAEGGLPALGGAVKTLAGSLGGGAAAAGGAEAAGGLAGAAGSAGGALAAALGPTAIATGAVVGVGLLIRHVGESTGAVEKFAEAAKNGSYDASKAFGDAAAAAEEGHRKAAEAYNGAASDIDVSTSAAAQSVSSRTAEIAESLKNNSNDTNNWTENIKSFFESASQTTTTKSGLMRNAISSDLSAVDTTVQVNTASMGSTWSKGLEDMKLKANTNFSGMKSDTSNFMDGIKQIFSSRRDMLKEDGEKVIEGFNEAARGKFSSTKDMMNNGMNEVANEARAVLHIHSPSRVFAEIGEQTIEGYNEGVDDKFSETDGFFSNLPSKLLNSIGDMGNVLTGKGSDTLRGMLDGINDVSNGDLSNVIRDLPNRIVDGLGNVSELLRSSGNNVIYGFVNGINDVINQVGDALTNGVGGAVDNFKRFLGIASPSKLFKQLGIFTGEGYEEGVEKSFKDRIAPLISGMGGDIEDLMDMPEFDFSEMFETAIDAMVKFEERFKNMTMTIRISWRRSMDEMLMATREMTYMNQRLMDGGMRTSSAVRQQNTLNFHVDKLYARDENEAYALSQQLNGLWNRQMAGALA